MLGTSHFQALPVSMPIVARIYGHFVLCDVWDVLWNFHTPFCP